MIDFEAANRKRDRRLRRRLLGVLYAARGQSPMGGLNARVLVDVVEPELTPAEKFDDDTHAWALLRDLANGGYATLANTRKRTTQRDSLDHLFLAITDRGVKLMHEEIPADPSIEDERNLEGE